MLRRIVFQLLPLFLLTALAAGAQGTTPVIEATPAAGVDLIVVNVGTNETVAGASVTFLDTSGFTYPETSALTEDASAWERHAPRLRRFRADDEGRVRIPFTADTACVRVTSGEWASARLIFMWRTSEPMPLRVELELEHFQRVLAVDAAGHPQPGVRVAITVRRNDDRSVFVSQTTGADGIAELPHMQRLFTANPYYVEPRVAFDYPTLRGRNPGVPLKAVSVEPVKIVVPVAGSLRVRVKGPKGTPLSGPVTVSLFILPLETQGQSESRSVSLDAQGVGEAFFPLVGLCDSMMVQAIPGTPNGNGGGPHFAQREIAGPTHAGHELKVELVFKTFEPAVPGAPDVPPWMRVPQGTTIVLGKVLDPDGRPVAGAAVEYLERSVEDAAARPVRYSWHHLMLVLPAVTKADGAFELRMREPDPGDDPSEPGSDRDDRDGSGRSLKSNAVDQRVSIEKEGFVTLLPIKFARGDKLDIRLVREARLGGRLRLDPGVNIGELTIHLAYDERTELTDWLNSDRPHGIGDGPGEARRGFGGRFEWRRLAPGRVTVRIGWRDELKPVLEIAGIEIAAGQVVVDARLQDIDLRGKLTKSR